MAKELRCGYTTGSCAAAGVKAALHFYQTGIKLAAVEVTSPAGDHKIVVPVERVHALGASHIQAVVVKDAGDDIDITHGALIAAEVRLSADGIRTITGGKGVGTVTRAGLSVPVGQAAINPGPVKMIERVLDEMLAPADGVRVTIQVPDGEALAVHTLNPILGIEGGISIIGTDGIVRPMSEDAFKDSLVPQLRVIHATGSTAALLTPGKIGLNLAVQQYGLAPGLIAQTSNFIGYLLEQAAEIGLRDVLLFGHAGKLIKVAGGIFNTHSHIADARQEILAAYLARLGAKTSLVEQVLSANTTEAVLADIEQAGLNKVFHVLAKKASERAVLHVKGRLAVGTAILALDGRLLGYDAEAERIGERLGWKPKSLSPA